MNYEETDRGWRDRVGAALDRVESIYLRVLRAAILVIATLMIAYAAWLAISSIYKISRSPDSVVEEVVTVDADELTNAESPTSVDRQVSKSKPAATPEQRAFYAGFVDRYYTLYRNRFEPYRQPEDKRLSRDEFDDNFVDSQDRLEGVVNGDINFQSDSADLQSLFTIMTEAAAKPATISRLQKYRAAKKVRTAQQVQRTRTEYRRGWDSYSMACEGWYYSPVGCAVRRAVQVPYSTTVYSMEFPKNTQSHTQIFRAFQERYFQLLGERREANAQSAENERSNILSGQVEGGISLLTALQVAIAFLALMFFFLLIAIERHQRRMSAQFDLHVASAGSNTQ